MFRWPLIFLGFALISGVLGFAVFSGISAWTARIVFGVGLFMSVLTLYIGRGKVLFKD